MVERALSTLAVDLVRTLAQTVACIVVETHRLALPTAALGTYYPLASGPVADLGRYYLLACVRVANLQHQGHL